MKLLPSQFLLLLPDLFHSRKHQTQPRVTFQPTKTWLNALAILPAVLAQVKNSSHHDVLPPHANKRSQVEVVPFLKKLSTTVKHVPASSPNLMNADFLNVRTFHTPLHLQPLWQIISTSSLEIEKIF